MTICKQMIGVLLVVLCAGNVYAQQAQQAIPGQPSVQSQPLATPQPQSTQPASPQPQTATQPAREKTSVFEMYVSDKPVEITDKQFEIIKKLEGIVFSYISKTSMSGQIAVPVKVVKSVKPVERYDRVPEVAEDVDAGYLVGTQDAILSAFRMFGIITGGDVSTNVRQFGYDLFRQPPSSFSPVEGVPVGPDYVLGPGDEIKIAIWGNVEGQWTVVVDRDGHITVPKIGAQRTGYPGKPDEPATLGIVGVTGLTFQELKNVLYKQFSKYYTGFEMNVSMGALRTIRVYVVGNAEKPGAYTISSLSTLVNALFEAGGPSKKGTMRDIQVKRNGKAVVHFDMYDFLLKGDKSRDVRLMPEDVIFIPPVGDLVAIAGNVKNPAIYELKGESKFSDLIDMTGGLTATAFHGRVQIQRIENHKFRNVYEGDLVDIDKYIKKNFILKDGDIVKVFSIIETKNTATITGAVANAGDYGIDPGVTRLMDVISLSGGLVYYASDQAELTRTKVTQSGPQTERINIDIAKAKADIPQHNVPLEINDYVFVRSVPGWQTYSKMNINGEVKFPGTYPITKGERLSSLIERAGGYSDFAYLRGAVFTRERLREVQQRNMEELITRLERELMSASSAQAATATSTEAIAAGKAEAEQKQKFLESLKKLKATGRLTIHLAHLRLLKGSEFDIELEGGDSLYIPVSNSFVNVAGSVMSQGSFIYSSTLSSKDYIELAGGASKYADTGNMYIMKVDGSAMRVATGLFSWNSARSRWEIASFGEPIKEVEPGDTIVVPEKVERIAWMREIKDIAQIVANIAISAGVVKALY
ncbi:MAG: SLBB domain-containing protein [Proteobacteria bacterium]|nr:SLBB domain-containing protein [Pseudomonadota bacterium]